ncbi:MAG: carbohydrate-binding family 9-like protein [Fimbriimonadales bacterium]|nr:carbohydrate-binding family 9-like protein [Fimbriimonadales bacterium]
MQASRCTIVRAEPDAPLSLDPRADLWRFCDPIWIASYPWHPPGEFLPRASVRVAWQPDALCLLFRVEDRFVRCLCAEPGGPVWRDSCVEAFFSAGEGYFNLEANCGGTPLLAWQTARNENRSAASPRLLELVEVTASSPRTIDPEIVSPYCWSVAVRLPFALLSELGPLEPPRSGQIWRGNFYHCNENGSLPRWGSWAPIDAPEPDFHRPEFFGEWVFG